ncbi:glucuronosyltransferase [Devosia sp. PTR5]|uniref:Glucuronosyltransferase n=1 Tax=Devosia oryzisoli TaxID=2774138 RepID=A0A927FUZ7_9HYPH|nr:glycosyltransferase [Devosia oryzisoli]MBD8066800.1 glucuronosyltransferase [Devosia oryzisoli]
MIFVTVGSMLPFDRFIKAMDDWTGRHGEEEVFAQIGQGSYEPRHMRFERMLSPSQFKNFVLTSDLVVAHGGMGSVIMAAEAGKPILLFPRRASLGEHTTEHQLHTVNWLKERPGIHVVLDEAELDARIEAAQAMSLDGATLGTVAPAPFVERLRQAILD